ncbi:class I adenylate-forming enzyme family protein [Nitrosopumilus sp. S6]
MDEINKLILDIFDKKWDENFVFDSNTDEKIRYSEFLSEIISIQQYLQKVGIRTNDVICTLLNNSLDFMKLYFVALISNFTIVPIDPEKGKEDVNEIINFVKPKIVIIEKEEQRITHNNIEIKNIVRKPIKETKDNLSVLYKIDSQRDFLITFTSGTTGSPKGVVHSIQNLILSALAFNENFNFDTKNVFFHNLPMSYMAGILNTIFLPFISNSKIVIGPRFSLKNAIDFWEIPKKYSVNTFWLTPTIIGLLLKFDRGEKGRNYTKNRNIIGCVGTSALNYSIKKKFEKKYNISLYESYGLSEVLFVSTNSPKKDDESVGEILNDVELKLKNEEILIKVPWMLKKYYNSENKKNITEGYFISGDLGRISGKKLTITGRKKELIVKGGINISPKKLEDFIINEKFFDECIVLGFPDDVLGEKTVCFVLENSNNKHRKKELNKKIVEKLGKDYHIDEFVELNEISKTTNGKTNKPKIKENYLNSYDCTT